MTNKLEEHSLPYISPSVVTFRSEIDRIDFTSESTWDPDWTIQREISVTIDKSVVNDSSKLFSKKIQIIIGIILCIGLILSVILPILIFTVDPYWPPSRSNGK